MVTKPDLKSYTGTLEAEEVLDAIITAVAEGKMPQDAVLLPGYDMRSKAEDAVSVIENATDADIRNLADLIQAVLSDGSFCVIGNENNIQKEKELFKKIRNLNV